MSRYSALTVATEGNIEQRSAPARKTRRPRSSSLASAKAAAAPMRRQSAVVALATSALFHTARPSDCVANARR